MSGISKALILKLVAFAQDQHARRDVDSLEDDVLDYAAETLGFDDDFDALWEATREALISARANTKASGGTRGRGGGDKPKVAPAWDAKSDQSLLTAPFRFVPLNKDVFGRGQDPVELNKPKEGRFSCILDVTWRVETPVLVGEQHGQNTAVDPFKLGESYALPGPTIRGCLRALMETVAFGRLFQVNKHARFALRDFEHDVYKRFVQDGQQAGWLTAKKREDGGYDAMITPCSWGYVPISELGITGDGPLRSWVGATRREKYRTRKITWTGRNAFRESQGFTKIRTDEKSRELFRPDTGGSPGYLVVSGAVPQAGSSGKIQKQFEYLFREVAGATAHPLSEEAWARFEITNCKPSANKRVPDGAWKEFVETVDQGGRVPVFYTGDLSNNEDPGFSFGLTRLYRIPHDQSIGDLILKEGAAHRPADLDKGELKLQPDFVEQLFGYVYEPKDLKFGHSKLTEGKDYTSPREVARKGRIACEFAEPVDANAFEIWPKDGPIRTIQGVPKPSYAPFYLVGKVKDYSNAKAGLAGRKSYITREKGERDWQPLREMLEGQQNEKIKSEEVFSTLRFLAPKTDNAAFRGKIRLHNVTEVEIGAVLWALTFGGDRDARHLMGRGKPFGAGQMAVSAITLKRRANGNLTALEPVNWTIEEGREKLAPWLDAFETAMNGFESNWRNSDPIQALLKIARPRGWTARGTTYLDYMHGGRQAGAFSTLRRKTGIGADLTHPTPPPRLLNP